MKPLGVKMKREQKGDSAVVSRGAGFFVGKVK